ncbi:hypothetical protein EMIHUDRAFT_255560 [Emiliania huxleyi CCMP1516]|uniref:Uncharacterized protein n=2 Tax=Emiliania huxleyi TaxID=2903 RepID=A0A0D3J8P4_EMIH1|nr:hypothetical protein EMIHUDRAFT_255560 [Emiliania huxleyi CCMP1516]EOD19879.1 hypothetical protein EMIHUDRAFT_255560 [Emiliania huxleyi CCMP1516]|eukprot:XP_005772308.1 hypothetical protein EMIHUDRAFT_255560 [Emiliania huxleyi CCMP1516]
MAAAAARKLPFTGTMQTIGAAARSSMRPIAGLSGFLAYYRGRCGGHTVTMFVFVDQLRLLYRQMQ